MNTENISLPHKILIAIGDLFIKRKIIEKYEIIGGYNRLILYFDDFTLAIKDFDTEVAGFSKFAIPLIKNWSPNRLPNLNTKGILTKYGKKLLDQQKLLNQHDGIIVLNRDTIFNLANPSCIEEIEKEINKIRNLNVSI